MKKLTAKQRLDIAALEQAIEYVREGGIVDCLHVSKTKEAHNNFQEKLSLTLASMRELDSKGESGK